MEQQRKAIIAAIKTMVGSQVVDIVRAIVEKRYMDAARLAGQGGSTGVVYQNSSAAPRY